MPLLKVARDSIIIWFQLLSSFLSFFLALFSTIMQVSNYSWVKVVHNEGSEVVPYKQAPHVGHDS